MVSLSTITGLIDQYTREAAERHPEKRVDIAVIASAITGTVTELLTSSGEMREYASLLDLCHALDSRPACALDATLAPTLQEFRSRAQKILFQQIHDEKLREAHAQGTDLRPVSREWRMAQRIAAWIYEHEKRLPASFGPAFLEEHADPSFAQAAKEFAYDLSGNAYDWEKFSRLLPAHLRQRFDPLNVGMHVPEGFQDEAEATEYLNAFLRHYGLTSRDLLDWNKHPDLIRLPGFRVLLRYFSERAREEERQQKEQKVQADSLNAETP